MSDMASHSYRSYVFTSRGESGNKLEAQFPRLFKKPAYTEVTGCIQDRDPAGAELHVHITELTDVQSLFFRQISRVIYLRSKTDRKIPFIETIAD